MSRVSSNDPDVARPFHKEQGQPRLSSGPFGCPVETLDLRVNLKTRPMICKKILQTSRAL